MSKHSIALRGELESRGGAADLLSAPGDAVIITRGKPRWFLLRCPCGCGEDIPVNVDHRAGKAWRLYRGDKTGITLFPSVWRDTGCQSHFIIWRDRILMFGPGRSFGTSPRDMIDLTALSQRALAAWPRDGFIHFVEVADILGEIPYDVQEACVELVKAGELTEGLKEKRGWFRRDVPGEKDPGSIE